MNVRLQIDGELVVWDPDRGRTSLAQMQRRLTAGHGCGPGQAIPGHADGVRPAPGRTGPEPAIRP